MTLGRQFENTYWEDPETEETHTWTRGIDPIWNIANSKPLHQIGAADILARPEQPLQGLLFHPATGTGSKDDPMIPAEVRRGVIRKSLDLTSPSGYKENLSRILGKITSRSTKRSSANTVQRSNISDAAAENHMKWITNTLFESDMPTHVIAKRQDRPIKTVLDPIPGRAWAESNGGAVRLTMSEGPRTKQVTTTMDVNVPSEIPIHNPKFWNQLDSARSKVANGDSHNSISADNAFELATHWVHPETGHVMTKEFAENLPIDRSQEPIGESVENTMETPALVLKSMGYVPNLFPGAGKPGSKNHAVGVAGQIETGYGDYDRGQDYTRSTFHTRFKPGTIERKDVVSNVRIDPKLSERTLVHELGHAMDANMGDRITNRGRYVIPGPVQYYERSNAPRWRGSLARLKKAYPNDWQKYTAVKATKTVIADPMEEGVADAVADRYTNFKGHYEDALANVETRSKYIEGFSGYTTRYSGWKNDTQRALYAATRYHTALSDAQAQQIPSRSKILGGLPKEQQDAIDSMRYSDVDNAYLDTANSLALGHIYHHMPHVHGLLKQMGLHQAAQKAHQDYKKRMGLDIEHPVLPGLEDYV